MKSLFTFILLWVFILTKAQVTIVVDSLPDYTPSGDDIYIVGSFNGWNPGDNAYKLEKNADDLWEISLDGYSNGETIEFKFTRGGWGTVEKGPDGEEIDNRSFTFGNGETVSVIIYNWADAGGGGGSTAADNVFIMDEDFYMPQLDRYRRIWIYLPPDYEQSQNNYPVLYMHNGQNLFDVETSFAGEWEIDETLNELAAQNYHVPIVVGIDNDGQHRADEYLPYYNPSFAGGEGDEYMAFIVETLKPHIDANYRTKPDRENTGIMGSSLGGIISLYGAVKYQDVFSKCGPFSPAYWANYDSIYQFVAESGYQNEIRFYQNSGENEGGQYIDRMYMMEDSLHNVGFENVVSKVIAGGEHNEATWAGDFEEAYLWLFNQYATSVKYNEIKPLKIYPNPVENMLYLNDGPEFENQVVSIIDMNGNLRMLTKIDERGINLKNLDSGNYIIRIQTAESLHTGHFVKL